MLFTIIHGCDDQPQRVGGGEDAVRCQRAALSATGSAETCDAGVEVQDGAVGGGEQVVMVGGEQLHLGVWAG